MPAINFFPIINSLFPRASVKKLISRAHRFHFKHQVKRPSAATLVLRFIAIHKLLSKKISGWFSFHQIIEGLIWNPVCRIFLPILTNCSRKKIHWKNSESQGTSYYDEKYQCIDFRILMMWDKKKTYNVKFSDWKIYEKSYFILILPEF